MASGTPHVAVLAAFCPLHGSCHCHHTLSPAARPTPSVTIRTSIPGPAVAGWKEFVALPELGIPRLKAKLDTGARTSALHASRVVVLREDPLGRHEVEIVLAPHRHRPRELVAVRTRLAGEIDVTDSGGHRERRPLVETLVVLGPLRRRIRLSLTDRSGMLFPLILGRKAFEGALLVDVAAKYLLRRRRRAAAGGDAAAEEPA